MKSPDDRFRPVPNRGDHNCFACGPNNPGGLAMKFYSDGETVVSRLRVDEHLCGWDNLLHGGIISTMLDEIMSWTIIHLLQPLGFRQYPTNEPNVSLRPENLFMARVGEEVDQATRRRFTNLLFGIQEDA